MVALSGRIGTFHGEGVLCFFFCWRSLSDSLKDLLSLFFPSPAGGGGISLFPPPIWGCLIYLSSPPLAEFVDNKPSRPRAAPRINSQQPEHLPPFSHHLLMMDLLRFSVETPALHFSSGLLKHHSFLVPLRQQPLAKLLKPPPLTPSQGLGACR